MEKVRQLNLYGNTVFKVQHKSNWNLPPGNLFMWSGVTSIEFMLCVSAEGLRLLDVNTGETLRSFIYDQLARWHFSDNTLTIYFWNSKKGS